jgi:hypothetical protein
MIALTTPVSAKLASRGGRGRLPDAALADFELVQDRVPIGFRLAAQEVSG